MKLHPRYAVVKAAENELRAALADVVKKHDLTDGEALSVVNAACSDWISLHAKYEIRIERHGTTEKKGDEA